MLCKIYTWGWALLVLPGLANGQVNNTGNMYVPAGGNVSVWGGFTNNTTGNVQNAGNLYLRGDVTSNGTSGYNGGTLHLAGTAAQTLNGSAPFNTTDIVFNNTGGFNLNTLYSVSGAATFTAGIVTAGIAAAPLEFNPGGTGAAAIAAAGVSDAAHVNGYVRQKGTGVFVYPVGNAVRYQPVAANLGSNSNGMLCRYTAGDAGTGGFVATGTEATLLRHYNAQEYWTLTPAGTAGGTVTVYYDDYNNIGIGPDYAAALRVAHKAADGWRNEGSSSLAGDGSSGAVTSNLLSDWSPFTLGSISDDSPLPVDLSGFSVSARDCQAVISWNTGQESGLQAFEIQYSTDGNNFTALGNVAPGGPGSHYNFTTDVRATGHSFFRLCLRHTDGTYSYSKVLDVQLDCNGGGIVVYPNPLSSGGDLFVRLEGYSDGADATLYDMTGRKVRNLALHEGVNTIPAAALAAAQYMLEIYSNGRERQVFKITVND